MTNSRTPTAAAEAAAPQPPETAPDGKAAEASAPVTASPAPAATPPTAPANGGAAPWTIQDAKELYNIDGWGAGFFDVNDRGHVIVRPDPEQADRTLDLYELVMDLEAQGVTLPVLLRFSDILKRRIETLS